MPSPGRVVALISIGLFGAWGQAGSQPERVLATTPLTGTSAIADRQTLAAWDRTVTDWVGSGRLITVSRQPDRFVPGRTLERFEEFHRGVPVFGGGLTRQLDEAGSAVSILGTVHGDVNLDVAPRLGSESAGQAARDGR